MQSMSNQELINKGVPTSLFLPGTQYWKNNRTYKANSAILNFDEITTNSLGSSIRLDATQGNSFFESGISFGAKAIQMSSGDDTIRATARTGVKLGEEGLLIEGAGYSFFSPTAASLNLGGGKNFIAIGGANNNWANGLVVGGQLIGGSGVDSIRATGTYSGIGVSGLLKTDAGDDVIDGKTMNGESAVHVDNSGRIEMGAGNDRITVRGGNRSFYINGSVSMGDGKDLITGKSLHVHSYATAVVDMGAGDDTISAPLISAGNARLQFGSGADKLTVRPGTYNASAGANGTFILSGGGIEASIQELEFLVSSATGNTYAFKVGSIDIA